MIRILGVGPVRPHLDPPAPEDGALRLHWTQSKDECAQALAAGGAFDVLVCDVAGLAEAGGGLLAWLQRERPELPVVLLSPPEAEPAAVAALARGAASYVLCSADRRLPHARLSAAVEWAVEAAPRRWSAHQRSRLLAILRTISRQSAPTTDLASILSAVAEQLQRYLAYEQVAIYLVEPDTGRLALCAVAGTSPAEIAPSVYHLRTGEGTPGQSVARRESFRVDDFTRHPGLSPALGQAPDDGHPLAELSVPILNQDQAIGAITITARRPSMLDQADEELAWLAEHLVLAIQRAEFLDREVAYHAREALLTSISRAVNSSLGLSQVLQQAVTEVGRRLKADRCLLCQVDVTAGTLRVQHEFINPLLTERRRLKGRQQELIGPLRRVARLLRLGEVIVSTVEQRYPLRNLIWDELSSRYEVRSLVSIPLVDQHAERFYCLALMQVTHAREWGGGEIALLRSIADQLALAVRNAELFDAMQRSTVELQSKNAELEAFVYTVSHDLQAPVVSLRGFASLLQSRYGSQLDQRGATYVSRISANVELLGRMLKDLLELSRVGRRDEPEEQVAVGPVVESVLGDLAAGLAERGVQLAAPAAWPVVRYSRTHLRQVFSNLLSNALKFLGPQREPRIEIGWRRLPETSPVEPEVEPDLELDDEAGPEPAPESPVEFFVKDNGIGIHPDYHQRIFTPFQRLNTVEVEGTGVGLSIVKRIVERHGGSLRVESGPQAGAAFYFTVPRGLRRTSPANPAALATEPDPLARAVPSSTPAEASKRPQPGR